jgi:hypothetical protein
VQLASCSVQPRDIANKQKRTEVEISVYEQDEMLRERDDMQNREWGQNNMDGPPPQKKKNQK